ncbi:MAG: MFS transporter [Planctomycetota bacterium]
MEARQRGPLEVLRRYPDFRRLYLARLISQFGDWFNLLAILHLLGNGGDDVRAAMPLAVVFVLKIFPNFLFGPIAGVLADRLDRRRIQITCNVLAAGVVLVFLTVGEAAPHWQIYLLSLLQVSISAFYEPARQAILPNLVPREDLLTANALYSVTWSAMYALGSTAGGVTVHFLGWEAAIVVDACTYLVAAWILLGIRHRGRPRARPAAQPSLAAMLGLRDIVEGLAYRRANGPVRRIILAKFGWGSMGAISLFLTLLGHRRMYELGGGAELGVAYLWFFRAIGTGVGPFLARWYGGDDERRLRRAISLGFVVALSMYALLPLAPDRWTGGLMVMVAHFGGSAIWVTCTVLLMRVVPDELRGRTFAAELGLTMLSSSLSNLAYAALFDYGGLSLDAVIVTACAFCALPALAWMARGARD